MTITLTRFIGLGIWWCDSRLLIGLPFFTIEFDKNEKGIKFVNDWEL